MDQSLPRTILGVVAGVIAGGVIVFATEAVGHSLFPPPPAINLADPEDVKRLMASLPAGAFAFVLAGWFLGSFAGAFVARLGRQGLCRVGGSGVVHPVHEHELRDGPAPHVDDLGGDFDPLGQRVAGASAQRGSGTGLGGLHKSTVASR